MKKPMALDLFCGGGGATIGLQQAGFEVVGIDKECQKHYPATFIQADIEKIPVDVWDFDLIWASPPCQLFSPSTNFGKVGFHVNLIPLTRWIFWGHPFTIIENVERAPIRKDIRLAGPNVGLNRINRVRHFEVSFWKDLPLLPPLMRLPKHVWDEGRGITITTSMSSSSHFYRRKARGLPGRVKNAEAKQVMGIPAHYNMTDHQIGNAVPPPYAKFIGEIALPLIKKHKEEKKGYGKYTSIGR